MNCISNMSQNQIKQKYTTLSLKLVGLSQDVLCASSRVFPMPPYCNKVGRSLLVALAQVGFYCDIRIF